MANTVKPGCCLSMLFMSGKDWFHDRAASSISIRQFPMSFILVETCINLPPTSSLLYKLISAPRLVRSSIFWRHRLSRIDVGDEDFDALSH